MASTKLVYLRSLIGTPLTEVVIEGNGTMILTNVILIQVGRDWSLFRQGGSGGVGDFWVPNRNIATIII
ncbi:hypothetical protein ACTWQL_21260 [Pseudalkalibacillus sp. R45]|uniref:hypothetical protein n=1 Tax=Pseudalkalibacillus sp. R45 TaxID=3457433 RepID=UPI003FCCCBBC